MTITPTTIAELVEAVCSAPSVLAVGANTKARLTLTSNQVLRIATTRLVGISEYEPDEFTFTALSGTPVRDIALALEQQGQYLPFDPLLTESGATIGGTVAAGISGSGRFRYGGVRDFIIGVRFIDGTGRLLRMGGKVVKNAAGFDLPKFFVGSAGRFGVIADVTFKVFPRRAVSITLRLPVSSIREMAQLLIAMANTRWEPDALDASPATGAVYVRFSAPPVAIQAIVFDVLSRQPGTVLSDSCSQEFWADLREFRWAHSDGVLIKVPLTPAQIPRFCETFTAGKGAEIQISAGGNLAFISFPHGISSKAVDGDLKSLGLSGMTLRGAAPLWMGISAQTKLASAMKLALDPQGRFPSLYE